MSIQDERELRARLGALLDGVARRCRGAVGRTRGVAWEQDDAAIGLVKERHLRGVQHGGAECRTRSGKRQQ